MPSRGADDIVAVTSTTDSPHRTTTAPLACLASCPVSNDRGRPATSTSTRPVFIAVLIRSPPSSSRSPTPLGRPGRHPDTDAVRLPLRYRRSPSRSTIAR